MGYNRYNYVIDMKAYLITNKWSDGDPVKETICVIADTVNEAKSMERIFE